MPKAGTNIQNEPQNDIQNAWTRTWEWRNQNPPILREPSMLILKKLLKFGPLPVNELVLYSECHEGREDPRTA